MIKINPARSATYSCERRRERKGTSAMRVRQCSSNDDTSLCHSSASKVDHGNGRDPCVWVVVAHPFGQLSAHTSTLSPPTSTMKRSGSGTRAPSPTNTSFSGISSYRTDLYKPLRDKSSVTSPPLDPHLVARIHYDELSKYLVSYLAKGCVPSLSPPVPSHAPQNPPTLARLHDRNSQGSLASNSKNSPQMSTMN